MGRGFSGYLGLNDYLIFWIWNHTVRQTYMKLIPQNIHFSVGINVIPRDAKQHGGCSPSTMVKIRFVPCNVRIVEDTLSRRIHHSCSLIEGARNLHAEAHEGAWPAYLSIPGVFCRGLGTSVWNRRFNAILTNRTMHVPYPTIHRSEQKCAHFCSEWCIMGYGTGAKLSHGICPTSR